MKGFLLVQALIAISLFSLSCNGSRTRQGVSSKEDVYISIMVLGLESGKVELKDFSSELGFLYEKWGASVIVVEQSRQGVEKVAFVLKEALPDSVEKYVIFSDKKKMERSVFYGSKYVTPFHKALLKEGNRIIILSEGTVTQIDGKEVSQIEGVVSGVNKS